MVKLKINQENQIEDGKTAKDQNVKSNESLACTIIIILDDRDITMCQKPIKYYVNFHLAYLIQGNEN